MKTHVPLVAEVLMAYTEAPSITCNDGVLLSRINAIISNAFMAPEPQSVCPCRLERHQEKPGKPLSPKECPAFDELKQTAEHPL